MFPSIAQLLSLNLAVPEVFNTYGDLDNAQLLQRYGFVEEANRPHSYCLDQRRDTHYLTTSPPTLSLNHHSDRISGTIPFALISALEGKQAEAYGRA